MDDMTRQRLAFISERIRRGSYSPEEVRLRLVGLFDHVFKSVKNMTECLPSDQRVYNEITNYMQNFIANYNG